MGDASEFIVVRYIGNCLKADPSMARAWQPRLASCSKKSRNDYIIDDQEIRRHADGFLDHADL